MSLDNDLDEWEIEDIRLRRLDWARIKLNGTYATLDHQLFDGPIYLSRATVEEVDRQVGRLETCLRTIDASKLSSFDYAVLIDIEDNVKRLGASMNYFYHNEVNWKVSNFLYKVYGERIFGRLINMLRQESQSKRLHEYSLREHVRRIRQFDTDFEFIRERLQHRIEDYKKLFAAFCIDTGILSKPLEYKALLSPPSQNYNFWDDYHKIAAIDPNALDENKITPFAFLAFVHECGGHALNSHFSKNMPRGLRLSLEGYLPHIQGVLSEGTALQAENASIEWIKKNKFKFDSFAGDLETLAESTDIYVGIKLWQVVYDLLVLHEMENEDNKYYHLNAKKKFAEITGVPRFYRDYFIIDDRSVRDTLHDLQYIIGRTQTNRIIKKMKKKINFKSKRNRIAGFAMLQHGFWTSPRAKEMFITGPLLEQMMKGGKII